MALTQSPTSRTSVEQKLKARNCALMLKNGSPKLRDLLREVNLTFYSDCLIIIYFLLWSSDAASGWRIQDLTRSSHPATSRWNERWVAQSSSSDFHFPSKIFQKLINEIVYEEMAQEIDRDIELHEIILKEILDNWEQWQNEEFEKSVDPMEQVSDELQVFCPVCERNLLNLRENIISCSCGLRFVGDSLKTMMRWLKLSPSQTLLSKDVAGVLREDANQLEEPRAAELPWEALLLRRTKVRLQRFGPQRHLPVLWLLRGDLGTDLAARPLSPT